MQTVCPSYNIIYRRTFQVEVDCHDRFIVIQFNYCYFNNNKYINKNVGVQKTGGYFVFASLTT